MGFGIDVLFIYPPTIHGKYLFNNRSDIDRFKFDVPYGLLSLASYITDKGFTCIVVECDTAIFDYARNGQFDTEMEAALGRFLENRIRKYRPRFVGLSVLFNIQISIVNKMLKWIKTDFRDIEIIIGGNAATYYSEMLEIGLIDHLVRYEGEIACLRILQGDAEKVLPIERLPHDKLPIVDWNHFHINQSFKINDYQFYVPISRGCLGKCNFCNSHDFWEKFRVKNWHSARKEISGLVRRSPESIFLGDDTLVPEILFRADGKCLLDGFEHIGFMSESRADKIICSKDKHLEQAFHHNLNTLLIGAESGADRVLTLMNKKITTKDIIRALTKLKRIGYKVYTYWIFGYPGSCKKDDLETLNLIKLLFKEGLHEKIFPHIFRPFRGTPVSDNKQIRILQNDFSYWGYNGNDVIAIHELIRPSDGKIVYSRADIEENFRRAVEIGKRYE